MSVSIFICIRISAIHSEVNSIYILIKVIPLIIAGEKPKSASENQVIALFLLPTLSAIAIIKSSLITKNMRLRIRPCHLLNIPLDKEQMIFNRK